MFINDIIFWGVDCDVDHFPTKTTNAELKENILTLNQKAITSNFPLIFSFAGGDDNHPTPIPECQYLSLEKIKQCFQMKEIDYLEKIPKMMEHNSRKHAVFYWKNQYLWEDMKCWQYYLKPYLSHKIIVLFGDVKSYHVKPFLRENLVYIIQDAIPESNQKGFEEVHYNGKVPNILTLNEFSDHLSVLNRIAQFQKRFERILKEREVTNTILFLEGNIEDAAAAALFAPVAKAYGVPFNGVRLTDIPRMPDADRSHAIQVEFTNQIQDTSEIHIDNTIQIDVSTITKRCLESSYSHTQLAFAPFRETLSTTLGIILRYFIRWYQTQDEFDKAETLLECLEAPNKYDLLSNVKTQEQEIIRIDAIIGVIADYGFVVGENEKEQRIINIIKDKIQGNEFF